MSKNNKKNNTSRNLNPDVNPWNDFVKKAVTSRKKSCQLLLQDAEKLIYDYNDSYPNCVGDCVYNMHIAYMSILTIASFVIVYIKPVALHIILAFSVVVGLVNAIGQGIKYKRKYFDSSYDSVLNKCKYKLQPFDTYPDVQKYIDSLEPYLRQISNKKKMYRWLSVLVFVGYLAVVSGYVGYLCLYDNPRTRQPLENIHDTDGLGVYGKLPEYFKIKLDEPLFSLSPLEGGDEKVGFFIVKGSGSNIMLRFALPNGFGAHQQLEITNTAGKVALQGHRDTEKYNGETGCVPLFDEREKNISALKYLRNHADSLRYRIVNQ